MNKFLNITLDEYHQDKIGANQPSLNYSTAKTVNTTTALQAWLEHPKGGGLKKPIKKQMNLGTIIGTTLLTKGAKAQLVDAPNWRTNKAKAERDEAIAAGNIPLLPDEYETVIAAATTITQQLAEKGIILDAQTEQAMMWEYDGVVCRGCMDMYTPNSPTPIITELKCTEWPLTKGSLRRLIRSMSYDIQAAAYSEGVHLITGEKPEFRWIFAEMKPPYLIRIATPSDLLLQLGFNKWDAARKIWKACLESGVWTGYGDDIEIEPDLWELREYELSVYPTPEVIGDPEFSEPSNDEMWF